MRILLLIWIATFPLLSQSIPTPPSYLSEQNSDITFCILKEYLISTVDDFFSSCQSNDDDYGHSWLVDHPPFPVRELCEWRSVSRHWRNISYSVLYSILSQRLEATLVQKEHLQLLLEKSFTKSLLYVMRVYYSNRKAAIPCIAWSLPMYFLRESAPFAPLVPYSQLSWLLSFRIQLSIESDFVSGNILNLGLFSRYRFTYQLHRISALRYQHEMLLESDFVAPVKLFSVTLTAREMERMTLEAEPFQFCWMLAVAFREPDQFALILSSCAAMDRLNMERTWSRGRAHIKVAELQNEKVVPISLTSANQVRLTMIRLYDSSSPYLENSNSNEN